MIGDLDKPFLMYVEDVFSISGRGTVVTGKVERGTITKGSEIEILGMGSQQKTTLTGIGKSSAFKRTEFLATYGLLMMLLRHGQKCSTRSWTEVKPVIIWARSCEVSSVNRFEGDRSSLRPEVSSL